MTKEEKIIQVIHAYNSGANLGELLARYKCSKSWIFKWLKRFKADPLGPWYIEQSRKPKTIHCKTSEEDIKAVIATRLALGGNPYNQRGAISIQYKLSSLDIFPFLFLFSLILLVLCHINLMTVGFQSL